MVTVELMAHLVRHIIDIKWIANRRATSCNTSCFLSIITNDPESSQTATISSENMPNIIVSTSNLSVYIRLIFVDHRSGISIRKRVCSRIRMYKQVIIRNNYHCNCHVPLKNTIYTIHCCHLSSLS